MKFIYTSELEHRLGLSRHHFTQKRTKNHAFRKFSESDLGKWGDKELGSLEFFYSEIEIEKLNLKIKRLENMISEIQTIRKELADDNE